MLRIGQICYIYIYVRISLDNEKKYARNTKLKRYLDKGLSLYVYAKGRRSLKILFFLGEYFARILFI